MGNIALANKNALAASLSWYGDEDVAFPKSNLSNAVLSKPWRYSPVTSPDGGYARLGFSIPPFRTNHLALCAHNMSESAQIRLRAGTARLDSDFTTDNPLTHNLVFSGGVNGTRTDEYGTLLTGQQSPRYEFDRRYYANGFLWSEDFTQSWAPISGAFRHPDGKTVSFSKAGGFIFQGVAVGLDLSYSDVYEYMVQARLVEGNGDFTAIAGRGGSTAFGSTKTATSDWQWFTFSVDTSLLTTGNVFAGFYKITGAGVLQFRKAQFSRGPMNGAYRKTTTQRRYRARGLITEAAATNSVLWSADPTNAAWAKSNVTTSTLAGIAPDGTAMTVLTATLANGSLSQNHTLGGTTQRGLSFYFRKANSTSTSASLMILWSTGGTQQSVQLTFNPSTGDVISTASAGATLLQFGVKDCGLGMYRAFVVGLGTDALNTVVQTRLQIATSGQTVASWGYQNEATGLTTYIPTTTAALTRSVDTAVVEQATWVPYVWNPPEGTLYHEVMADDIPGTNNGGLLSAVSFRDAGGTNIIETRLSTSTGITTAFTTRDLVGGAVVFAPVSAIVNVGVVTRQALRWRSGDWQHAIDGVLKASDPDAVPSNITIINLMQSPAPGTAYLRRVTVWPTGRTNEELQALSLVGPGAVDYDSGWDNVVQMSTNSDLPTNWGNDFDIIKTFPTRSVEWIRIDFYDPAKVVSTSPFSIGMLFSGANIIQPAVNGEYGLENRWRDNTTFTRARDGRKFFNQGTRDRESAFSYAQLTHAEGAAIHEMQGNEGISGDVIFLPDPDDEAECQRYGMVGNLKDLDPIAYPEWSNRTAAFQVEKRR
jgi:hypothetical protein